MVKEIVGTQLGAMKFLRPILEEWKSMMQDSEWGKKDAPWWYNERALLSLFAGAIWKCDGWAFEEFATSKHTLSKRGRRTERTGRGDIMFQIGEEMFVAEAKQCWPILGYRNHGAMKTFREALHEAQIQSSRLPSEGHKLGIVFAVPCLHKSKEKDLEGILRDFEEHLRSFKNTATAWVFPKGKRKLSGGDGYFYPGVVLAVKPLRIRKRSR